MVPEQDEQHISLPAGVIVSFSPQSSLIIGVAERLNENFNEINKFLPHKIFVFCFACH